MTAGSDTTAPFFRVPHWGEHENALQRRTALAAIVAAIGTVPFRGLAQRQGVGVRKVGFLTARQAPPPGTPSGLAQLLKPHGFEDGRNLLIERRYAAGDLERLPGLARELVGTGAEVILAAGNASIGAAPQATRRWPMCGIRHARLSWFINPPAPRGNSWDAFHTPERGQPRAHARSVSGAAAAVMI